MFSHCCSMGLTSVLLNKRKKDEIVDCWYFGTSGVLNVFGDYVIPKTGYYALSISSYGADVNEARNMIDGTAFYMGFFTKGENIHYKLGNKNETGSLTSQAYFQNVQLDTKTEGSGNQQPSFMLRWIGNEFNLLPARLVDVAEIQRRDSGLLPRCNVFEDGTDVFALNGNRIFTLSKGDWAVVAGNKAHWYLQNVQLNQLGEYQVYVLGDDEQRLALNGIPIVWSQPISTPLRNMDDCRREQKRGSFTIDEAKEYQFLVMQVNVPSSTPSWTAVVIKQPDGSLLDLLNNWQYIETVYDCENKYIVPTEVIDNHAGHIHKTDPNAPEATNEISSSETTNSDTGGSESTSTTTTIKPKPKPKREREREPRDQAVDHADRDGHSDHTV